MRLKSVSMLSETGSKASSFLLIPIFPANNKIKVIKCNAYSYRTFNRFGNRILHMFFTNLSLFTAILFLPKLLTESLLFFYPNYDREPKKTRASSQTKAPTETQKRTTRLSGSFHVFTGQIDKQRKKILYNTFFSKDPIINLSRGL